MKGVQVLFLISILIYLLISLQNFLNLSLPDWINFYVNDFLCMPIVLGICLVAARLVKNYSEIFLSLFSILSLTVFYAIFFEGILPKIAVDYTADIVDVLMYFFGAFLFYFVQKVDRKQFPSAEKTLK